MDKVAGVYRIKNVVNGKIYIGSSVDLMNRMYCHKSRLRRGIHKNPHLQSAWNKYGEENFEFTVLEIVENKDDVLDVEQLYLDTYHPDYNVFKYTEYTRRDDHLTDEHKEKISKSKQGTNVGEDNHFYGRKHSRETKKKLSIIASERILSDEHKANIGKAQIGEKSHYAKLTWDKVREIRRLYEKEHWTEHMLIDKFNMSQSAINKIVRYKTWREQ